MSPFAASSTHPSQPLPHVEKLTPQEQESLHEHRRSAQAMLSTVRAGFGPTERRATPESSGRSSLSTPGLATEGAIHNRSGSLSQALPFRHDLSFVEKNRLLEHRNSTPDLIYDAMRAKRSSNDPTDMNIQPLPSRDSRSGVQWFSQVSTPTLKSEPPMTPRDIQVGVAPLAPVAAHRSSGIDSAAILPPIVRSFSESEDDRRPRPRSHSSHIHPLSRPSSQSFGVVASSAWTSSGEATDRLQFDSTLSPTLERRLEEWYYPIRKKEVQDAIEQMETREFLGLKTQVAKSYANEQFRNPEFLGNMTSILCVIRAPHPSWKNTNTDIRQASEASNRRSIGGGVARPRQSRKGMDVDDVGGDSSDDQASNSNNDMDVDEQDSQEPSLTDPTLNIERPCRYALDIDMDPLGRDPEPDLRAIEGLTINSLFPTKSFVTGFEPAMVSTEDTAAEEEACPKSLGGYPSNARIGRFYLPERAFRTPESLNIHPNPNGPWVCCRFKEYRGVSIWVLESVLESYHELAQRHKMALTLQGVPMYHRTAMYDHDEWEIRAGEQCDVKVKETVLYPEMIQQVWKDMHQSYVHQHQLRQQPQQQLQQQYKQRPEGHSHQLPPHLANRVSTYEEYQKSLWQADPRRESYPNPHPRPSTDPYGDRRHYDEYRQYPQSLLHREDLSSAPSSPNSPRMDDFQEDNHDSVSSTLGRHQDMPSSTVGGFTNLNLNSANMHRRISIAELCNPMQSLATERGQSSK
ncbi:hypothetical protein BGZ58_008093 [Dissophora ornata]|nr:hypothetical protein BGZ58_008093 [Dissophora ornata]